MRDFCTAVLAGIQNRRIGAAPFFVAIDGPSGGGKTTLAQTISTQLSSRFNVPVTCLHMDDFYLPQAYQTADLAGNINFPELERVLAALKAGRATAFAPFDCKTQQPKNPQALSPTPIMVLEGSYALHPRLRNFCDFSIFLTLSPALQRHRLLTRQTPSSAESFFRIWIPKENAYFSAFSPGKTCDLLLAQK